MNHGRASEIAIRIPTRPKNGPLVKYSYGWKMGSGLIFHPAKQNETGLHFPTTRDSFIPPATALRSDCLSDCVDFGQMAEIQQFFLPIAIKEHMVVIGNKRIVQGVEVAVGFPFD